MKTASIVVVVVSAASLLAIPAAAQDRKVFISWTTKGAPVPYSAPNKPITRIADVLAKHKGQADWSEDVIQTERYHASWIQMGAGKKTRSQFYGDDRTAWAVWGGKIRFHIFGQQPFVASKGFLVQVPLRVPYWMETAGDEPSLRFEVTRGGALPSYPLDGGGQPSGQNGQHYVRISYPPRPVGGGMGTYDADNKPYLDFFKEVVEADPTAIKLPRLHFFMKDADNQAATIRGQGVAIPPDSNKGHFHIANDEFWFIPEGKTAYLIESVGLITAGPGDVVLVPPNRWHRASFAPGQVDTRIAFNRSPSMLHNYAEDAGGTQ